MTSLYARFTGLFGLKSGALRAGVLNTGELVLMDAAGHSQVFSAESTDLIRDVLGTDEQRLIEMTPLPTLVDEVRLV